MIPGVEFVEPWWCTCLRTAVWVSGIALASGGVAWVASSAIRRGSALWWTLVVGAAVPPFTTWCALWVWLAPDRAIGAMAHAALGVDAATARPAVLALALLLWASALCTSVAAAWHQQLATDQLAVADGVRGWERLRLEWNRRAPGVAAGVAAVALLLLGESTAFDLAQVRTAAFELRSLVALGAPTASVIVLATPVVACSLALAVAGVAVLQQRLDRSAVDEGDGCGSEVHRARAAVGVGARAAAAALCVGVVLAVIATLTLPLTLPSGEPLRAEHLAGLGRSLGEASAVGALLAGVACVVGVWWTAAGRSVAGTRLLLVSVGGALVAASVPAALVAMAARAVPDEWAALVIGHGVRFAAIALIGALLTVVSVSQATSDAARLRGGFTSTLRALRPAFTRLAVTVFVLSGLAAFTDVSLSALLDPVGSDRLATRLVDALHYQRPGPVVIAVSGMVAIAVAAGVIGWWWQRRRVGGGMRVAGVAGVFAALGALCGCEGATPPEAGNQASTVRQIIGSPGRAPGCFEMPRALDVSSADGSLAVIDKTGRVQIFDAEGKLDRWWRMPETDQGMPTGVTWAPDGTLWVADTHEHRVVRFDREGSVLQVIGAGGMEPGRFIYPTDVAVLSDGRIMVSEYGGNDRIQVFSPEGSVLRIIGQRGEVDGPAGAEERESGVPRFDRPQSIVVDESADRCFVADACHHRIVELTLDGTFVRAIGAPGKEAGSLWYPYGVAHAGNGHLVVCEFGANRLQSIDLARGAVGPAIGSGGSRPGEFATPWAVAVRGHEIVVCDARNGRVQVIQP